MWVTKSLRNSTTGHKKWEIYWPVCPGGPCLEAPCCLGVLGLPETLLVLEVPLLPEANVNLSTEFQFVYICTSLLCVCTFQCVWLFSKFSWVNRNQEVLGFKLDPFIDFNTLFFWNLICFVVRKPKASENVKLKKKHVWMDDVMSFELLNKSIQSYQATFWPWSPFSPFSPRGPGFP